MTEWADRIGAIETAWRSSNVDLPAGVLGFERGARPMSELGTGEIPHVFARDPTSSFNLIRWFQRDETWTITSDLVVEGETQEQIVARIEGFRDAIFADITLGGLVERVTGFAYEVQEFAGEVRWGAVVTLEASEIN